jgi:hypothetical protein
MSIPDIDDLRARAVGRAFPGGVFRVAEYERWLSQDAMHSPPIGGLVLHPVWILLGALRGMGVSIDELTALAGAGAHDGTVFGETVMEQNTPLEAETDYLVRGGVVELVRREGKRAGVMDLMTFRLELVDPEGAVAAVSEQTFVFPRRTAA